jgi:hypothetical protein
MGGLNCASYSPFQSLVHLFPAFSRLTLAFPAAVIAVAALGYRNALASLRRLAAVVTHCFSNAFCCSSTTFSLGHRCILSSSFSAATSLSYPFSSCEHHPPTAAKLSLSRSYLPLLFSVCQPVYLPSNTNYSMFFSQFSRLTTVSRRPRVTFAVPFTPAIISRTRRYRLCRSAANYRLQSRPNFRYFTAFSSRMPCSSAGKSPVPSLGL